MTYRKSNRLFFFVSRLTRTPKLMKICPHLLKILFTDQWTDKPTNGDRCITSLASLYYHLLSLLLLLFIIIFSHWYFIHFIIIIITFYLFFLFFNPRV